MSLFLRAMILGTVGVVSFGAGLFYAMHATASDRIELGQSARAKPKKTDVDFEGLSITGELRNPGDFYFQRKTDEKFDSLVKRRKNFHREMLRDVVMAK